MKVGDMVVRSYVMPSLVPGIIIGEETEAVDIWRIAARDTGGSWSYDQVSLIVAWSDGTMSREMSEELLYLEEAINESR
jgi:hypothetical protein